MTIEIGRASWSTDPKFTVGGTTAGATYFWTVNDPSGRQIHYAKLDTAKPDADLTKPLSNQPTGAYEIRVYEAADFDDKTGEPAENANPTIVPFEYWPAPPPTAAPPGTVVRLERGAAVPTNDEVLSILVHIATDARSFRRFKAKVGEEICRTGNGGCFTDTYAKVKAATMGFLENRVDAVFDPKLDPQGSFAGYFNNHTLPYLADIVERLPDVIKDDPCSGLDLDLLAQPFPVELIWSYWQEEGGLVQTMNLLLARFQNRRVGRGTDPLARFDLSPLRPLRHLLWAWAEDEAGRLTVRRRAAEYEFEYGLPLVGRAVAGSAQLVERRSLFLEAFHNLLYEASTFFALDDNTTINANAFPLYNAIRDTHLVLAEGASNQFGDLPTQARAEMLIMQWILAQPEIREYLGGKPMVPYEEPWMDRVDTMKTLYGWSPASITHFHELAVRGERLLLTVRWGNWNSAAVTADSAKNWARTWRNDIERYLHSYRAVTGVDLAAKPDARPPGLLLSQRRDVRTASY